MYPPPPPGPYGLYPPPPGPYPPYPPRPLFIPNPIGDPSFWVGLEGLVWWSKNPPLSIPVVTTGPASLGSSAGALGAPGTVNLNGPLDTGAAGGIRLFAGGWFTNSHCFGIDGSLFLLGRQDACFCVRDGSGLGNFVINEPVTGVPFSTLVSAPGIDTGSVVVNASTRFGGGDINLLYNLYRSNNWTFNLLGGYRYLELTESLNITANSTVFTTNTFTDNMGNVLVTAPPGSVITVFDQFNTRNQFNGGQLGGQFQYLWKQLFVGGTLKLAIGATHEEVTISGGTNVFPTNGTAVPLQGGNFATLQVGRYWVDRFAVSPEGRLDLGYYITPCIRAQLGYTFLYLSNVARPGKQIDNTFDGVTHPIVPMTSSSFWTQGINAGFQFSF
jgi:hypothetical protein